MKVIDHGVERELTQEELNIVEHNQRMYDLQVKKDKIQQLKRKLSDTDYQVIKNYEYFLANKELPYDIDAIHDNRQALRDEINRLEGEV